MYKTIALVFKVLILTVLLGTLVTLVSTLIDAFVTFGRIQNIAEYVQMDVAKNNCLLNDTYTMFKEELNNVQDRSETIRVGCYDETDPDTGIDYPDGTNVGDLATRAPVQLVLKSASPSKEFDTENYTLVTHIQREESAKGRTVDEDEVYVEHTDDEYYVGNYGDILVLRINCAVVTKFWRLGGSRTLDDNGYVTTSNWLTLSYDIPCLSYIK